MSVARRGESGVASASSNWRWRQRQIQSSCWAAEATRRRWAAAARASRSCWAAEATRQRWAGAARANRNSAVSSGPIITRVAKRSIAATTRTPAIPIAINISYNNIRSPPPLAVGTEPLACFSKVPLPTRAKSLRLNKHMAARASRISTPVPRCLTNAQSMSRVPDLLIRKKQEQKQYIAAAKWFALAGFGRGASRDFLRKKEPHPCLPLCFDGKRDRGEPLMLNVSLRPQPAAIAAVSALARTSGETSSDEFLVEQIAAGSKPAMQTLFARHRTYVYRWLLRFVSNETLAEDLLSEVFLDVWRQAGRFECRSSVSTWLMSIARHKALSACRRRTDAELDEKIEATIADPADDPEVALQEKDRDELLRRALTRLSPERRQVIDLVYYHEKSVDEVAQILDVPPATVKTRMFYARKKLAELVQGG